MPRRIRSDNPVACYHCMTRIVNGEKLLSDIAKEVLRKQIHQVAAFSGVEVITYAIMTNHFHVLIRVPEKRQLSDVELLRRYKLLYPKATKYATDDIEVIEADLKNNGARGQQFRRQMHARMNDLSWFMKTLKQRFSVWYNRTHNRYGTLWADRYASTVVQGGGHMALQTVAAYIDLNPVRAGLVEDPKDYRWCGYGEAISTGNPSLLFGLRQAIMNGDRLTNSELLAQYRVSLYSKGAAPKASGQKAKQLSSKAFIREEKRGGKLALPDMLRLRLGWMIKGAVLGSFRFVKEHLGDYRRQTNRRLHTEPRPARLPGLKRKKSIGAIPGIYSMRSSLS